MSKFLETKTKLREAVIEANTLRKLQNWLSQLGNEPIDCDLILFYIDETKKFYTNQYKQEVQEQELKEWAEAHNYYKNYFRGGKTND